MVGKKYVSKDDLEAFARKLTRRVSGSSVHGGGGNGGGGATDCYWTKVLNDIYYDDGIVGIRTMTDDVRDAELQWAVGAADVTKYTMGVDDDDSDAWLLCSGDILTSTQEAADLGAVVITYSGRLGVLDYGTAISHRVKTHLSDNTLAHVSHFHLAEGDGDDEASNPIQDICSDGTYYYITDLANHRIKKHRMSDGLFMWAVGGPASGTGNDEFNDPWGICTDGTYLYVADRTNLRIKKHLCSTGAYVAKVGSYGTGPNQFVAPVAICTDGVHLYITQNGGWPGRLEKYTCGLVYVGQMNNDGYVDSAALMGICVSGSYLYAVNNNWSNGTTVYALYKYSTALAFVAGYSKTGTADNEFDSPYGICTDGTHLYITETASPQIKKIKVSDFSFVAKIGSSGLGDDQFAALTGICANATFTYSYAHELRTPILKAGLDGSYCDSYPLFRARDGFQLMEDGTVGATDYVGLYAPAAITASYSLTFPGTGPAAAGHFAVDAAGLITWGQNLITTASPNFAGLSVGTNDLVRGLLYLYGHDTGGVYGGTLICYTSADHDAVIGNYGFMVKEDDLLIGPDTNVDALLLDSNDDLYVTAGSIILPASEYLNFGGTLGSGGYGVRDNAGDIEYCDSGGSWIALNSLGGGPIAFADLSDYPADAAGVLTNDGAGNLSWEAAAGGGGDFLVCQVFS